LKSLPVGREVQQPDDSVIDKALNDIRNVRFAMKNFYVKTIDFCFLLLRLVIKFVIFGRKQN
jgi:hypothetical protein